MKEKWKKIKDFPDYEVSDQGRVRSWKNNRWGKRRKNPKILKPGLDTDGYFHIALWENKARTMKLIHRLILETFTSPCPKEMECCHNNGIGTDNRIQNLRWDTPKNNHADKIKHGTSSRKLSEKQVLKIRKDPRVHRLIAADYGVVRRTVSFIKTHETWAWLK